jgi:anti-sigma regulatory factor (Ser/Thr protein kinase)
LKIMIVRRRRFCGGAGAPRHARRAVRETLGDAVSARTLGDVELLVSELATNSVRHAGCDERAELDIEAAIDDGRVLVRVCDDGDGFEEPALPLPGHDEPGGYGLLLLNRLAAEWGIQREPEFCVWFEVERR